MARNALVAILIILFFLAIPGGFPWAAHWGYAPAGGLGLVLVVLLALLICGVI